ncbi:hypothetical protein PAXRUDRAFT_170205, partial [Paxillus rubicundulus Ve08.2h10]
KTRLEGELKARQPISDSDQEWLDNAGNLVDEEQVVDALDHASDYEQGLKRLNSHDKSVVEKLKNLAGSGEKNCAPVKKCKCPELPVNMSGDNLQKVTQKPAFTKKENATLEQRITILDWHHTNGENQSKTAKHFNAIYPNLQLKQLRISAWCKNEGRWQEEYEISPGSACSAKRICQTQHPEVTKMLDLWISKAMADGILLTSMVLHQKWTKFADLVGVPEDEQLNLGKGWLTQYKTRTGLKEMKHHGKAASVASKTVDKERPRIQELIKKCGYQLCDIFNADESSLFYA